MHTRADEAPLDPPIAVGYTAGRSSARTTSDLRGNHYVDEENLAAENPAPQARARVSREDQYVQRATGVEGPAKQGAVPAHRATESRQTRELEGLVPHARLPSRLRHGDDFARLRRAGRSVAGADLRISTMANGLSVNRYGFVVGKRLGNAVTRNKVKRYLREIVRHLDMQLHQGNDIVLIAYPGAAQQPQPALRVQVAALYEQLRLFREGAA
jgi:ribonuclease P protein component